jgi:hypothetical protein
MGWLTRIGPWVGMGTSPAALMLGGGVGEGLEGADLVIALVVGVVLLTALASVQGVLGQATGLSLNGSPTLGEEGAGARAVVMRAMMLGCLASTPAGWRRPAWPLPVPTCRIVAPAAIMLASRVAEWGAVGRRPSPGPPRWRAAWGLHLALTTGLTLGEAGPSRPHEYPTASVGRPWITSAARPTHVRPARPRRCAVRAGLADRCWSAWRAPPPCGHWQSGPRRRQRDSSPEAYLAAPASRDRCHQHLVGGLPDRRAAAACRAARAGVVACTGGSPWLDSPS